MICVFDYNLEPSTKVLEKLMVKVVYPTTIQFLSRRPLRSCIGQTIQCQKKKNKQWCTYHYMEN